MYSFTEMAEYLLTLKGVDFLLSEKFNQDPLEIYFSKQRSRGARGDNPSVHQCLQNAQAIRTPKTLTLGNCSNICKRKATHNIEELSAPCPSDDLCTLSIIKQVSTVFMYCVKHKKRVMLMYYDYVDM